VRTRRVLFLNINPYLWGALFGTDFYRGTGQLMFWNVVWEITLNKLPSGTVFFYIYYLISQMTVSTGRPARLSDVTCHELFEDVVLSMGEMTRAN
jgi:hypothetical protein